MTVGKPEVIINGESRPLDVPPIIYHGVVLVPVRVISEGMGAYVQWVPDRRLVVVRYIPATPPPTEAPPPPAPEATVAPPPPRRRHPIPLRSSAATFVRTTSRGKTRRTIPARSSTSRRAPNTTRTASIRRLGTRRSRLHGDYNFPGGGWDIGGTYLYANPINGPCVVPANHAKGSRVCVTQVPPNTNPDDTLPRLHAEHVLRGVSEIQGVRLGRRAGQHALQVAVGESGRFAFETGGLRGRLSRLHRAQRTGRSKAPTCSRSRTGPARTFSRQTLLTSYPAGNNGLAPNIIVSGRRGHQHRRLCDGQGRL